MVASHVGQRPTCRFDRSGEARTGATGAVTGGNVVDGSVATRRSRPNGGYGCDLRVEVT